MNTFIARANSAVTAAATWTWLDAEDGSSSRGKIPGSNGLDFGHYNGVYGFCGDVVVSGDSDGMRKVLVPKGKTEKDGLPFTNLRTFNNQCRKLGVATISADDYEFNLEDGA